MLSPCWVVEALDLAVLGNAQAGGELADHQDGERPDRAPGDDGGEADDLFDHVRAVGHGVDRGRGEDAGQDRADDAADAVDTEGVQAVVILQRMFQPDRPGIAGRPADQADQEGALGINEAGGGGDGDQTADDAGQQAQQGRTLLLDPFDDHPAQGGGGGGDEGVQGGDGGDAVGGPGAAGVEAQPADEQKAGADGRVGEVGGRHIVSPEPVARAEHQGADQTRDAGVDVHHRAAGEVQHAPGSEVAAAPDLMADRGIDDQMPQAEEEQGGGELHPLGERPRDQGRGDDGEGQLVGDPEVFRQAGREAVRRVDPHAVQEDGLQPADEAVGRVA